MTTLRDECIEGQEPLEMVRRMLSEIDAALAQLAVQRDCLARLKAMLSAVGE